MYKSASPRTLSEVLAQAIDYRVVDNHQLGANASCQKMELLEGGLGKFTDRLNTAANNLRSPASEPITVYNARCSAIISATKKSIPRGCREGLVPTWDEEFQRLYDEFTRAEPGTIANLKAEQLTKTLGEKRRERWESTTASIDFTHSSRQANPSTNSPCPGSANAIASKRIKMGAAAM